MNYVLTNDEKYKDLCNKILNFTVERQHKDGKWMYSQNIDSGIERNQIDFHQGFILESMYNIARMINSTDDKVENSIKNGARYYYENQFFKNGQSLWRIPKKYPVDIHNQTQGIITFLLLQKYDEKYKEFAKTIMQGTIENMKSNNGYFYYRKYKFYKNKIPYMRWSQAWMFLALANIME